MKPFDLEAAKAGKPIVTRGGQKARFLAHVPEADEDCRVLAIIEGRGCPSTFNESGAYISLGRYSEDLFMAPEKVTRWVNIYRDERGAAFPGSTLHDSLEGAAEFRQLENYITTVPVELEV